MKSGTLAILRQFRWLTRGGSDQRLHPDRQPGDLRRHQGSGPGGGRVAGAIAKTSVITESTGAISADPKDEKLVWGKKADWCDITGQIDGKTYGVAVLDYPANPQHPSNWHVRHYGLLAANIFGLSAFDKANPKGTGNLTIEKDKPVTFRYRVIIHTGDAKSAGLEQKFAEFCTNQSPIMPGA